MSNITFNKTEDVPFLFGGTGEISIDTGNLDPTKALDPNAGSILNVSFKANGAKTFPLGQTATVKVGVSTQASVALTPIFSSTGAKLLTDNGLGDYFADPAHGGNVILAFDAGGSADVTASGSFSYAALSASVEIDAGATGGFTYLRALDKSLPLGTLVPAFFKTMRLPEQGSNAPETGEAIALRYGGKLQISADVSAGYNLKGTKSISLGEMALSEHYDLSILGKIGLSAGVAGDFSILVTRADKLDNWSRVKVHRNGISNFSVAADVTVGFTNSVNLPDNADDFLGAVLGVNGKSVLNIFQKALELSDFDKLKAALDGLAQKYIGELIGKSFDALADHTAFAQFLGFVSKVVTSYQTVEDRAVTLFDKYFDKLDVLTNFLDKISALEAGGLDALRKDLPGDLSNIFSQLTDGDPLSFLLDQVTIGGVKVLSVNELKKRANAVLSLIRDDAHAEIRKVIGLAKTSLGLDNFFKQLASIDTVDKLQAVATDKLGFFVSRLVGRALDSSANLKKALDEVHAVLAKMDDFKDKLYDAFKQAANSSYKLALHSEYSRATERDALIDVFINMDDPRGHLLLTQAGQGNFQDILSIADPSVVKLQEGVFTHRVARKSAFKVNIIGWHLNYNYEGFDQVITNVEQRLIASDQGITVLSVADAEVARLRKRNGDAVHSDFLLRALGESKRVVNSTKGTDEYVIDALNSLTARYQLNFTDSKTSESELNDLLSFAKDLGIDQQGATVQQLKPFLPRAADGSFGTISASYDVRFTSKSIQSVLQLNQLNSNQKAQLRTSMRLMLLANYLNSDGLHELAFAYATNDVYEEFKEEGANFANHIKQTFDIDLGGSKISGPAQVTLDANELRQLVTLFTIEDNFIKAVDDLFAVLSSTAIDPIEFEKKLGRFGSAMKDFDDFDQTTDQRGIGSSTVFVLFNKLVSFGSGQTDNSAAMLTIQSNVGSTPVSKIFLTGEFAQDSISSAAAAGN
jgi:hypothetical protein